MLDNGRRKLELAFSLLFTLPGTPMWQFGDAIGLGDDLSLLEPRVCSDPDAVVQRAARRVYHRKRPVLPVIPDPIYGYHRVNVESSVAIRSRCSCAKMRVKLNVRAAAR